MPGVREGGSQTSDGLASRRWQVFDTALRLLPYDALRLACEKGFSHDAALRVGVDVRGPAKVPAAEEDEDDDEADPEEEAAEDDLEDGGGGWLMAIR